MIISLLETWLLNGAAWLVYCWHSPEVRTSPQLEEWFGWAPEIARFWLLTAPFGVVIAVFATLPPLAIYATLPPKARAWVGLRLGVPGSPPLVGALLLMAVTLVFFGCFLILAMCED